MLKNQNQIYRSIQSEQFIQSKGANQNLDHNQANCLTSGETYATNLQLVLEGQILFNHYLTSSQVVRKLKMIGELKSEVLVKVQNILQAFTRDKVHVTIRQGPDVTISSLGGSSPWNVLAKNISFS